MLLGRYGEEYACEYLKNENYIIIERNYYTNFGEIDIVAFDKEHQEIVFIEVKTRNNKKFGNPIDAINKLKMIHILRSSKYYLYSHKLEGKNVRYDAIEIYFENMLKINHVKNVFF